MARKKNATFTGVTVRDIDIGAATFKRTIENAVGDTALTFDKATRSNGETGTIIHDGSSGRGALLGMPIINHWVGRSLRLENPTTKGSSGGYGLTYIYPTTFHLAAGETELRIEVAMKLFLGDDVLRPFVKVLDVTGGTTADSQPLVKNDDAGEDDLYTAHLTGLSSGWNVLLVGINSDAAQDAGDDSIGRLLYVRARPRLEMGGHIGSIKETGNASMAPYDETGSRYGVTVPGAAEGVAHVDFEAGLFANLKSIDGFTLARLNRNLNGLHEFITGFPAGGNFAFTHEDQDGAAAPDDLNPARSRFEAHTRTLYANEGELDFPVWCESFGAFLDAGLFAAELVEPPARGMLEWFAPWPKATSSQAIRSMHVPVPDFQSAVSRLKCAVLCGSEFTGAADPTQWTIRAATTTGSAVASPVVVPNTNNHLWVATIVAVPFTGDANEVLEIKTSRAGAKPGGAAGIGEIAILGAAFAFDP